MSLGFGDGYGNFQEHMMNGNQLSYFSKDRKDEQSQTGERQKQILVTIGCVFDKDELYNRINTDKSVVGGEYPKDTRIMYMEIVYAKKGQYDDPPLVMGLCNGLDIDTYKTPIEFQEKHSFVGIASQDYTGTKVDEALTIYRVGTFNFVALQDIDINDRLCWIPKVDFIGETPNLLKWPNKKRIPCVFVKESSIKNYATSREFMVMDMFHKEDQYKVFDSCFAELFKLTISENNLDIETVFDKLFSKIDKNNKLERWILGHLITKKILAKNDKDGNLVYNLDNNKKDVYKNDNLFNILKIVKKEEDNYKRKIDLFTEDRVVARALTGAKKGGRVYGLLLAK